MNILESMDRQETDEEIGDDHNPDEDVDDIDIDIDNDEADVETDTHNELDESGRDDYDDDDEDMGVQDDSNINDSVADRDEEDIHIENGNVNDTPVTPKADTEPSLERGDQRRKGATGKPHPRKGMKGPRGGGSRKRNPGSSNGISSRAPSVRGLTIPFRTIKKSMKIDPDIPIVQNEAAIMATVAVELFLKRLVTQSHRNAKNRGRNTVRYEDVAEARTNDKALAFLETMLP